MNELLKIAIYELNTEQMDLMINSFVDLNYVLDYQVFHSIDSLFEDQEKDDFDLVVLSNIKSDINDDLLAKIKKIHSNICVLVIADNLDDYEISQLIRNGADLVSNPNNISTIGKAIRKSLNRKDRRSPNVVVNNHSDQIYPDYINDDVSDETLALQSEITELLNIEYELRENQSFYDTILENLPNLIYVKDLKTLKFTYINKASIKMIGYQPDEIIGKHVTEIFPNDYANFFNNKDIDFIKNGSKTEVSEELVLTKDNKLKIFFTKKMVILGKAGKPDILLGISEDLTENYKAQEELRKSEMRFSKIFHSSPVAIFVISSPTKEFVDVNTKFLEIIGYSREEVIGRKITEFEHIIDFDTYTILLNGLDNDSGFMNQEITINSNANRLTTLLISLEKMEISNESWGIFMGLDISERKKVDIEIQTALEKQKELNLLKTQFISMISHEFRTPLTTIMLSTDLLSRYSDKWQKDEREKHFIRIKDTILKMTQLMENVLIIGRIDSGKFYYNPESLDLYEFCESIAKSLEFSMKNSHKINLQYNGDCKATKFDENLLALIINNLLSNAIKYSPSASKVDFFVNCNGNKAEFIIRDYGIGIPEEELQHLYQAFFRANNVGPIAGYGLGLSIVKKCVDAHLGKIEVRSTVGDGTTMIVSLPIGG